MPAYIASGQAALSTAASGTQDFTIDGFGAPAAALFIVGSDPDGNNTHNRGGVGFTDGVNEYATGWYSVNGQSLSNVGATQSNARTITCGQSADDELSFNSWVPDGVRLTINNQSDIAYPTHYILFHEEALADVHVGTINLGTGTSAIDVTAPGFEPDLVLFLGGMISNAASDNTDGGGLTFGAAQNIDGVVVQGCNGWNADDNNSAHPVGTWASDTYCAVGTDYLGFNYLLIGDRGSALEEYKILKDLDIKLANKLFTWIYP